jgi:myo-inositol-1(or 4)-monophosphatase
MPDPAELVTLAEDVAREAGALLLDGLRRERDLVSTKTSLTDMVSEMDTASEKLILERLAAARPDDAVLAEEGGGRDGTSGVRWVVDPLDGTTNYLYAYPRWSVSIAAELDGEVVAAAVADPSLDEVFTATRGGGAFRNGDPIVHSGKVDVRTALVATGFSYVPERRAQQAQVLTRVLARIRDIRRGGAASLDLCWLACGRVDGYYEAILQPWDIAAGALIAAEAGAVVSTFDGRPPEAPSIFGAAPAIADGLLQLLVEAGVRESGVGSER